MKKRFGIRDIFAAALVAVSLVLIASAVSKPRRPGDTESAARRVTRVVSRRMELLDSYAAGSRDISRLPDDMVIYRYRGDSLVEWHNQFTVVNDDISLKLNQPRLVNPRMSAQSPLADIGDSLSFRDFGPCWYLVCASDDDDVHTIAGLRLINSLDETSFNGANPRLRLDSRFSIRPLSFSGGSTVTLDGVPQFKILYDSLSGTVTANGLLMWLAFAAAIAGLLIYLISGKTLKRYLFFVGGVMLATMLMYFWGRSVRMELPFFSPTMYADGEVLYSLGAVVLLNLAFFLLVHGMFLARKNIFRHIRSRRVAMALGALDLAVVVGICVASYFLLKSIILNSGISLELYKFGELSMYSLIVYASFLGMFSTVPMLLQMLQPLLTELSGRHVNVFSGTGRVIFAVTVGIYMVIVPAAMGLRKERSRLEVWANRLVVDRDISLEMQLRRVEAQIADDPIIASLSLLDNAGVTIRNRLVEGPLSRISQNYDVTVGVNEPLPLPLNEGERIAGDSRFIYLASGGASGVYCGVFLYGLRNYGLSRVTLTIEQRQDRINRGYSSILRKLPPGRVFIPSNYSYARYANGRLLSFRGNYPYPVTEDKSLRKSKQQGYLHFCYDVAEGESVIISRESVSVFNYLISAIFIALLAYLMVSLPFGDFRRRQSVISGYYASRLFRLLMWSLIITLVAMSVVSVFFVYSRNESNLDSVMTERIVTLQTMFSSRIRGAENTADLLNPDVRALLKDVGGISGSDVTLYAPDGRVMMSTNAMVFDRMYAGSRMDEMAYKGIMGESRRYFIQREKIGGHPYFSMYAPIYGEGGHVIAILCSPYTEENYDFESDAVNHTMAILSVFLLLMLLARFMATRVMSRLFKPLTEMGRKMSGANVESLEYIKYDRHDEVSALVDSYNRMVTELSESTTRLAQAERDKAWSGMARQVAHEIKNPLTPMKLQLQRIMRLKDKGDPSWQDKFDEMSKVLIDHIDMLTQTANEFSTFAKLYTEEPTSINLDTLLQEELSMFDNKGKIDFNYMGFENAMVMGPKPQLTRVFVNIINNAVQAVDQVENPKITVMLRKSTEDGFYDIVFEDNGPGVPEENIGKLFTPNFTTKSGGSGLGLAISRSVLEKCGAKISYSRSFSLGGACFTITYPK